MAPFINLALVGAANALLENYANTGDTPPSRAFVKANGSTGEAQLIASGIGARGVAISTSATDDGSYVVTPVAPSTDYFCTVTLQILTTGNYFELGLRANPSDRARYAVQYNPNGSLAIYKYSAVGANTTLSGTGGTGPTSYAWNPVGGPGIHTIKMQIEGTTTTRIRAWVDGGATAVLDVTDTGTLITIAGNVQLHWYNVTAPTDTTGILATAVVADVLVAPPSTVTGSYPAPVAGRLALSAVDPGNRMPDGGYMQPLLTPAPLKRGAPNATMVLGAWDKAPERARAVLTRLWQNKRLRTAVDDDAYDEFAARVGLRRVARETNDDLRTRIVATLAHGPDATTLPGLAALLLATYSIPVSTMDGLAGSFVAYATFSRYDGRLQAAPALIRNVKAAGIQVITRAFAPSAAVSDTVGTFAVGELALGAGDLLITIG